MFSGIVEEVGGVLRAEPERLTLTADVVLDGTRVADSIAVNGTCLTVTAIGADDHGRWFTVGVVPETLRRTNLGDLGPGDPVNLERAVAAGGRFGGHYVQGHVDARGEIVALTPEGNSVVARIAAPPELRRYIVPKGFIAVDGISLTVVEAGPESFTVALIPFTREHTNLGSKRVGDAVNLEVDILAKYVESLIQNREAAS